VSKSPAKSAKPSHKAVKKPAAAAKPAPRKKPAPAPAPKKSAKPTAKKATVNKTPAKAARKPGAKAAPKPVAKAAHKPVAKAAPKPAPKPVAKTVLKDSTSPAKAKPAAKPVPVPATSKPVAPAVKPASRGASSKVAAHPVPPPPDSAASRFADRFAPARPTRPIAMPEMVRVPVKYDPKLANAWKTKAGRDLSDDELLAMPDSEYMGEKQLEFFRVRLTALKDDLLSNAGETTEHLREDTSIVPDPADRATIEEEHALELRTRDRERKLLKKISQSLARIEAGDYGFCDETGEPIGLARLLARPTATLSLEAQQRREMKQKMFGD
jgi:DnaK suppressor protein